MMKFKSGMPWNKKQYKTCKKYGLFFILWIVFLAGAWIAVDQNQPFAMHNHQQTKISEADHNEVERSSARINESRNEFTVRVASNPQKIDWTGELVFLKVVQFLENPQTNIVQLFDEKINRLESEEYYAGAYYLQDHLYCELIWISNNEQLSLGFKLLGLTQDIKKLENIIEIKLQRPSTEIYQEKYYKKGWYDKVYNNMKYDMEYRHETQGDQSTLIMNIHPHIYH